MIHEIVSSDIEFAQGMMDSGHADAEILAYLASRSLDPAKAAQLVDDLRHGRKPSAQLPFELHPEAPRGIEGRATPSDDTHEPHRSHRRHSGSGRHHSAGIPWWFILLVTIALVALGYVLMRSEERRVGEE